MGQWTLQDRSGWFCGIRCDVKLKQTIQRPLKGSENHFVAGQTHKERFVARFELLFHEIVAITNLFKLVTSKKSDNRAACNLSNHFAPAQNALFNNDVMKLKVITKKRANSYNVNSPCPLHIVNQQPFLRNISQNVLNIMKNGEEIYKPFRKEIG